MTEFRSKGKGSERKVYPIKRTPYGEDRTDAEKAVQRLREENERARLIETNRKHKLYAPYASALKPETPKDNNMQENVKILTDSETSELIKKLEWLNEAKMSKGRPILVHYYKDNKITPADLQDSIFTEYVPYTGETNFSIISDNKVFVFYIPVKGKVSINNNYKPDIFSKNVPIESKVDTKSFYKFMREINKYNRNEENRSNPAMLIHITKAGGQDTITITAKKQWRDMNPKVDELPKLELKATSEINSPIDNDFNVEYINEFINKLKPITKDGELDFNILHPHDSSSRRLLNIIAKVGDDKYGFASAPEAT